MKIAMLSVLLGMSPALATAQGTPPQVQDTAYTVTLKEAVVQDQMRYANDTVRYHYNQMRYYVTTIMPYVLAATKMFGEINTHLNDDRLSHGEKKRYVKSMESRMRSQFEEPVKRLNTTQGQLLIKLIGRQTGLNIYHIVEQFKNPFEAMKYQAWARLNGINLNRKYDPAEEHDLERIMRGLGY